MKSPARMLGPRDRLISALDDGLRTLFASPSASRPIPAHAKHSMEESAARRHSAGLMRVNHAGEVCAQALYSGQALVARDRRTREVLEVAASEERDHLAWCETRLNELESRPSILGPVWFAGSFALGIASGLAGDRWSLGFLVETERQVERHLDGHLRQLPGEDHRSRAIVAQMRDDEIRHGQSGEDAGGVRLPSVVRAMMKATATFMTRTAYWV
jgi:ubiquinone biosynthesis monooxygenase Coq7